MDVLVVEPWFGGSHRQWAEGFAAHSRHDVTLLTLPDEGWKWRMRGAAVTLAAQVTSTPDVILASSLLDLAGFLGHARRHLAATPAVLYMHENQLTYPVPDGVQRDNSLALLNWTSMAAADAVVFNSEFHRSAWFEAIPGLLRSYPNPRHDHLVDAVRDRSTVLPVGVDVSWVPPAGQHPARTPVSSGDGVPLIVWNQRWEHDKRPDEAAAILAAVAATEPVRIALCGESPHQSTPPSFENLVTELGSAIVQLGYAGREDYEHILAEAAVVLSTAAHEFFGVAVVEAMAAGAVPVVPRRLSYPQVVGPDLVDLLYESRAEAVDTIIRLLTDRARRDRLAGLARRAAARFSLAAVAPAYDEMLEGVVTP